MQPDTHRDMLHIDDSIAMDEAIDQNTIGEENSIDRSQGEDKQTNEENSTKKRVIEDNSIKKRIVEENSSKDDGTAKDVGMAKDVGAAKDVGTAKDVGAAGSLLASDKAGTVPIEIERLSAAQKRGVQERELSVLLRQQGRAFSQALMTIAGTRQRSGRLWLICGATLIVITLLIIQVYYKHRDLNLGYNLSEAISTREALLEENRKLRIELRVLSRRERLEPYATQQLGMSTIRPDQIIIVHEAKRADGGGRRLDGLDNVRRIGDK